jgi:MFS family permease
MTTPLADTPHAPWLTELSSRLHIALPGIAATAVALGLCRFGYGPAMPALIEADWLTVAQAHALVWIHLAGYLALSVVPVTFGASLTARFGLAGVALAATGLPFGYAGLAASRCAAGAIGPALLAAGPSRALRAAPDDRRESVETLIYTGGGCGLAAAGLLAAGLLLTHFDAALTVYWAVLGAISMVFAGTFAQSRRTPAPPSTLAVPPRPSLTRAPFPLLVIAVLFGTVLATPTLWWPQIFVHRPMAGEHVTSSAAAALMAAVVGTAAIIGPAVESALSKWSSAASVLPLMFGLMALGFMLPTLSTATAVFVLASVLTGVALTGATIALRKQCRARCKDPGAGWHALTCASAGAQVVSALVASVLPLENFAPLLLAGSAVAIGLAFVVAIVEVTHG